MLTPFLLEFNETFPSGGSVRYYRAFTAEDRAELAARQRSHKTNNKCNWVVHKIQDLIDATNPNNWEHRLWLNEWLG